RGAVAQSSVDEAERAAVRAAQALKTAEEEFRLQEERWDKDKIIADFSGTIVRDSLGEEPAVSAGKEIATLADVSGYAVVAKVDELEIGQVREGQKAEVRLQAYDGKILAAQVSEIGSQAEDSALPEVHVTLTLQDTQGLALRPKLTAVVHIVTGQVAQALSTP